MKLAAKVSYKKNWARHDPPVPVVINMNEEQTKHLTKQVKGNEAYNVIQSDKYPRSWPYCCVS